MCYILMYWNLLSCFYDIFSTNLSAASRHVVHVFLWVLIHLSMFRAWKRNQWKVFLNYLTMTALKRLNIFPLLYRRKQGDLILAFRIFNYDLVINMSYLSVPSITNNLWGRMKNVPKPLSNKLGVGFRYSHWVVDDWDALPEELLSAQSADIFKKKLDLHWKTNCEKTNPPTYYPCYWRVKTWNICFIGGKLNVYATEG